MDSAKRKEKYATSAAKSNIVSALIDESVIIAEDDELTKSERQRMLKKRTEDAVKQQYM